MNLREIREQFIHKSGRFDLINEDGSDNGANFFLQAGQRFLDQQGDFNTGQIASWQTSLFLGTSVFLIPNCWVVQSLMGRPASSTEESWKTYKRVNSFTTPECAFSSDQLYTVIPVQEFPILSGAMAKDVDLPASAFSLSATAEVDATNGVRIKLLPKLSATTLIRAVGNFFSPSLVVDQDSNYWSLYHPEILLKAAMYELEVFYRNSEGAKDWLTAVQTDLTTLAQSELFASIQGDLTMGE